MALRQIRLTFWPDLFPRLHWGTWHTPSVSSPVVERNITSHCPARSSCSQTLEQPDPDSPATAASLTTACEQNLDTQYRFRNESTLQINRHERLDQKSLNWLGHILRTRQSTTLPNKHCINEAVWWSWIRGISESCCIHRVIGSNWREIYTFVIV